MNEKIRLEAEKYAQIQCEDMYNQIGLTGGEWGWETKTDFIAGATSDAAKEYWYEQFQKEKIEFAIEQLKAFSVYKMPENERTWQFKRSLNEKIKELEQKLSEL